ncbi:9220_t:CDS:10 [Ambispora leptoticha]|uniref:9220_t:CDS:1 n=1 Tax=Ambispora leptoticha TaxID=144679 RepID=A0A9N8WIE2_9GLOM|nr:9220_t:CDS:10 [Ambispora leptoticha]
MGVMHSIMSETKPIKVLATGSANGQIKRLFETVTKINEKWGPFDMHLCVGDLFGEQEDSEEIELLIKGEIKVPINAYFMYGRNRIPSKISEQIRNNSGQVCENLTFLEGERGVILTAHGARIAYVNGIPDFSKFDSIKNEAVDIFLSYEWPQFITRFSGQNITHVPKNFQDHESQIIAEMSLSIKPRYHFATAASKFFQREPYKNDPSLTNNDAIIMDLDTQKTFATWFVGLADVSSAMNQSKETENKWYYGFNLVPLLHLDQSSKIEIPPNITECPLSFTKLKKGKKRAIEVSPPPERYKCYKCGKPGHWIDECTFLKCFECNKEGHSTRWCPNRQEPCWFCLSNPKASKHLVVSVGTEVYLAIAKGGLIDTTNQLVSPIIPGGGHVLIVSLAHYETFASATEDVQDKISEEIQKYKESLREMFKHYGANMLTFQVSVYGLRHHAHIQVVPIPVKYDSEFIKATFIEEADLEGFTLEEGPLVTYKDDKFKECNFSVELPNGEILTYHFEDSKDFDQQFGRRVLADMFGTSERASWKACSLNQDKEKQDREQFRSAFKDFDFTLKE